MEAAGWIELWGACAVAVMVVAYACEERSPRWVLVFALACAASAGYAVAIASWPFAVAEGIWAAVALRRYRGRS